MPVDLLRTLRPLQIPSRPDREQEVAQAVSEALSTANVADKDQEVYLSGLIDEWQAEFGVPDGELRRLVRAGIKAGVPGDQGDLLARGYPALYEKLSEGFPPKEIAGLISQTPFAADLASGQHMSATQISLLLGQRLGGTVVPWKTTQQLLASVRLTPKLERELVEAVTLRDEAELESRFADAAAEDAAEIVGRAADSLGFQGDCGLLLATLFPSLDSLEETAHLPYLQVLEFQCLTLEFFDHPLNTCTSSTQGAHWPCGCSIGIPWPLATRC
jgi:hypothetical protein